MRLQFQNLLFPPKSTAAPAPMHTSCHVRQASRWQRAWPSLNQKVPPPSCTPAGVCSRWLCRRVWRHLRRAWSVQLPLLPLPVTLRSVSCCTAAILAAIHCAAACLGKVGGFRRSSSTQGCSGCSFDGDHRCHVRHDFLCASAAICCARILHNSRKGVASVAVSTRHSTRLHSGSGKAAGSAAC